MSQGKILIDGVIFQLQHGKPGGISRVWQNHLTNLSRSDLKDRILLLDRANTLPEFQGLSRKSINPYHPLAFEADSLYLQDLMDAEEGDLMISTYFTFPENSPAMIMLHDMTPEIMGLDLNHPEWRAKALAIDKACGYLAVSNSTKQDFQKLYPRQQKKPIWVVSNAASHIFHKQSKKAVQSFKDKFQIKKPYFLLVGRRDGYKNAQIFFRAFSLLENKNEYEVFCTGGNPQLENNLRNLIGDARCQVQRITDQELALAYAGAVCLVYPSLYEGFGLPILEAQQCSCPVITYNNSSLAEVAGAGAIYVPPHDTKCLHDSLLKVQQSEIREELILTGLENSRRYSWTENTQLLEEAIHHIFGKLPTIPRNPSAPLNAGIRVAYDLSRESNGKEISRYFKETIQMITSKRLTIDFQPLLPLEDQIKQLATPRLVRRLEKIIQSNSSDGFIHYWLGLISSHQGSYSQALDHYIQAIENDINSARINFLAAELAHFLKEWNLASQLWSSLASTFPQYSHAQDMLKSVQEREPYQPDFVLKEQESSDTLSPEIVLHEMLESSDINLAVERYEPHFSRALVKLIESNAQQAQNQGQIELAQGLETLVEIVNDTIDSRPEMI